MKSVIALFCRIVCAVLGGAETVSDHRFPTCLARPILGKNLSGIPLKKGRCCLCRTVRTTPPYQAQMGAFARAAVGLG